MSILSLALRSGGEVSLQTCSAEMTGWMAAMSSLIGCQEESSESIQEISCRMALKDSVVNPRFLRLFAMGTHGLYFDSDAHSFHVLLNHAKLEEWRKSAYAQSYAGYLAIIGGVLHEMQCGKPICLIHGALLRSGKGTTLFCGQSGIGKSTTSRRWSAAGGTALADDMNLLEFCEDGIWIHPLPTWSLCAERGMEGLHYSFNPPLHLDHLIILGRAPEHEALQDAASWVFFHTVYSACMFFSGNKVTRLPEALQKELIKQIQERTRILVQKYPSKAFLAHLDGNIVETLADYL